MSQHIEGLSSGYGKASLLPATQAILVRAGQRVAAAGTLVAGGALEALGLVSVVLGGLFRNAGEGGFLPR